MGKLKTTEEFKKEVYNLVNDEYTILGKYINNKTKIKIIHNKCGYEYEVTPQMFLRGRRCPKCSGKKKKTTKEFKKEIYNLIGNEYYIKSEYVNCFTKIEFMHSKCNNIFEMRPNDFLNGQRCPYCAKHRFFKKSNEEFLREFNLVSNNEYKVLENYDGAHKSIKIKHLKCNNIFKMTPNNFLSNKQRCPYCFGNKLKTTEEFKEELFNLLGNEYSILGTYKNSNTKVKIKHNICNNIYEVTPYHILHNNRRCPYCKRSKGEEVIQNYLENNNFEFETEFKFNDLKYKNFLKFDFKLENDDGRIILIEYDGEFHEKAYNKSKKALIKFKEQQERDKLKNDYCNSHDNIDLYRINYRDYSIIEDILGEIIKKYE